jgi:hypothetical protein
MVFVSDPGSTPGISTSNYIFYLLFYLYIYIKLNYKTMSFDLFSVSINQMLNNQLAKLEDHFSSDISFYYGSFYPGLSKIFCDLIEGLKLTEPKSDKTSLTIFLRTNGGTPEDVEKIVEIIRHHYNEVYFVIPDFAMSAGTIFVMSGDKIYMDYASSLGPIDPQVINKQNQYVPAMGYLNKINEIYEKSEKGKLTSIDYAFINNIDLAELRLYEQARDLSIELVTKFLKTYKFKSWTEHRTNNIGTPVTEMEKERRANEIADKLCDNSDWLAHGRYIGIYKLINELKIEIENYSKNVERKDLIRTYNDLVTGYIAEKQYKQFFHTKKFI